MRRVSLALVTLGFAAAVHLDWHAVRPTTHHLSLGWTWHWLLAVPVGALTAWYSYRHWPELGILGGAIIIGGGALLGGVVEPAWEYWVEHAPLEWVFGDTRNLAFAAFTVTAGVSHTIALRLFERAARRA